MTLIASGEGEQAHPWPARLFAWRTLIAAELVFGTTSGQGGLGWYIFEAKNLLDIPEVFGGLLSIILIGLFIENIVFRSIEARTVRRWGMQS
jgi:NitT/TauT family transport system permease protein